MYIFSWLCVPETRNAEYITSTVGAATFPSILFMKEHKFSLAHDSQLPTTTSYYWQSHQKSIPLRFGDPNRFAYHFCRYRQRSPHNHGIISSKEKEAVPFG